MADTDSVSAFIERKAELEIVGVKPPHIFNILADDSLLPLYFTREEAAKILGVEPASLSSRANRIFQRSEVCERLLDAEVA